MAFFEDIGKKVSQTSQDAIKKTKIMAETSKLNSHIAGEKRGISESFNKLGEKYFDLFGESPDENLSPIVTAIKEAQQRIDDFEDQVKKLKGIECCPNCGTELKDDALFCTSCGTKLAELTAEEPEAPRVGPKECSNCGTQLTDGVLFCSNCGTKSE